jgi:biopolymer transport protein ExbD
VLLVFFILVTTYTKLLKEVEAADTTSKNPEDAVLAKDVADQMISLTVQMENGKPVYRVEKQVVPANQLVAELRSFVNRKHNTDLLLDCDPNVPWEDALRAQDAAKRAGMDRIHYVVVPEKK